MNKKELTYLACVNIISLYWTYLPIKGNQCTIFNVSIIIVE